MRSVRAELGDNYNETYKKSVTNEDQCRVDRSFGCANPYTNRAEVCDWSIRYVHMARESLNYDVHLQDEILSSLSRTA